MKNDMKVLIPVVTFLVILFSCCSGNRYPDVLIAVDSIADTNPKKALTMLDSISAQMSNADEAVKNYYELLQIKAEDKAYVEHKSDILIKRLVSYYENDGDKNLLPMVYYYAGRINFDLNNLPEALKFFQKVLDVTAEEEPLRYKTYSQMGYVFLYQNLYDKGIKAFMQAYEYNKKIGNKNNQVYELCGIAYCYQGKYKNDLAIKYFEKALALSREIKRMDMEADIIAQISNHYFKENNYDEAKKTIQQIIKRPFEDKSILSVYSIAADIYDETGKKDSALLLYKELYSKNNIYAKHFASKRLGAYFLRERSPNALPFMLDYEAFSDSLNEITQTQVVAKIDALYNYQLREKENVQLRDKLKGHVHIIILIGFFSFVSISLLTLFIIYIIKKRKIEYVRSAKLERLLVEQLAQSKNNKEVDEKRVKELDELPEDRQEEENNLVSKITCDNKQLNNGNKLVEVNIENKRLSDGIETSDIYKKIKKLSGCNKKDCKKKICDEDWEALDLEINKYFPDFRKTLFDSCKVNEYEYKICLLIKINISPTGIAIFMNKTNSAISLVRKRLYKKVFNKTVNPIEWDEFICSL